jgi:putative FmdB family regulatory protein
VGNSQGACPGPLFGGLSSLLREDANRFFLQAVEAASICGNVTIMPIYEYTCSDCKRRMSFLVLAPSSFTPVCKYCKSTNLEQLYSRFSSPKSEEQRLESLADPTSLAGLDENDPKSVASWMKKMGKEMGEDMGEDFDQIAEEAAQEAASGKAGGEDETATPGPSEDL